MRNGPMLQFRSPSASLNFTQFSIFVCVSHNNKNIPKLSSGATSCDATGIIQVSSVKSGNVDYNCLTTEINSDPFGPKHN